MVPVALPLVLSLIDACLVLCALALGTLALGSPRPRPEAARVVAAAERGAIDLLATSAPWAGGFLFLVLAALGLGSFLAGRPATEPLTAALLGAILAALGAWTAGWQVARATSRLSLVPFSESAAREMGRLTTATLLLAGSSGSGLVACCFLACPDLPVQSALAGALSGVLTLTMLTRPAVLSWAAAGEVERGQPLHPGSLAALVGTTYTGTWLLHAGLFALSALGQVGLFALGRDEQGGLGTYALLLPRVGLFALVCAGLGMRASARDDKATFWLRGLVVGLVVLGGGAWISRGVLTDDAARTWVPTLVTYLCVTFGALATALGRKRDATFAGPLALLPVLLLAVVFQPLALVGGASSGVLLLVVAGSLSLLPFAAAFRLGTSALASASTCDLLATGSGEPAWADADADRAPTLGQQDLVLPLASLVALCAGLAFLIPRGADANPLVLGLGALLAALLLYALGRRQDRWGTEGGARLAELADQRRADGALLLGEGLAVLKRVGTEGQLPFALVLVGPPLVLTVYAWTGLGEAFDLAAGSLVGALLWATLAGFPSGAVRPHAAHRAFVWPLALCQLLWSALVLTSPH